VSPPPEPERRRSSERRRRVLRALLHGSYHQRRRSPRRADDRGLAHVDWHDARWLGVALLVMLLSAADAVLTLTLISLGAEEANPVMARLMAGSGYSFTAWKLGLTAAGVVVLTPLAKLRAFGLVPVGALLYVILAIYVLLVVYELWLLERMTFGAIG
jgi:hypothetical protein